MGLQGETKARQINWQTQSKELTSYSFRCEICISKWSFTRGSVCVITTYICEKEPGRYGAKVA